MSDEAKKCSKCDKKLRVGTPFETCGKCRTPEERRAYWNKKSAEQRGGSKGSDGDDRVLSSLGFGGENDKFKAPRDEKSPKAKRAPTSPKPDGDQDWIAQFQELGRALGLNPDQMLQDFARGWVQHTRRKALAKDLPQLPAGTEAEAAA
jgi:hypothetical protein